MFKLFFAVGLSIGVAATANILENENVEDGNFLSEKTFESHFSMMSKRSFNSLSHLSPASIQTEVKKDAYVGFLSYSGTTCDSTSLTTYAYLKPGECTESTDSNGTITHYQKVSCSMSKGLKYFQFASTDSKCSTLMYSSTLPLNVCPMDGMSEVYDCSTLPELNKKWKQNDGIVAVNYKSKDSCKKTVTSDLMSIYYDTSFDSMPLFTCVEQFKASKNMTKYYSVVCDGANGIQQLVYPKPNCKGMPTVGKTLDFASINCKKDGSNDGLYYSVTCKGPNKLPTMMI